jgi:hypothetical protein
VSRPSSAKSVARAAWVLATLLVNVSKKCRGRGPPFGALSEEGNAGLVRAVDWFDPERGLRDRRRAIRLPLHEGETTSGISAPGSPRSVRLGPNV